MSAPSPTLTPAIGAELHAAAERLRAAGIEDALLEAEVLLCHALGTTRERLYARLREPLAEGQARAFASLLQRRLAREPSAYITGRREFYGLELACTPEALIPRPESELIVDEALAWLAECPRATAVDVGTGTGALAIAVAAHAPEAAIIASDVSREALALARRNAGAHGVARCIAFVQGSLLSWLRGSADVIVANLPYIASDVYRGLPPEVREHEPEAALHAGPRGTELIESLLDEAAGRLAPGGLLIAEHAWDQGAGLRESARLSFPRAAIETKRDLAGRERALVVRPA